MKSCKTKVILRTQEMINIIRKIYKMRLGKKKKEMANNFVMNKGKGSKYIIQNNQKENNKMTHIIHAF